MEKRFSGGFRRISLDERQETKQVVPGIHRHDPHNVVVALPVRRIQKKGEINHLNQETVHFAAESDGVFLVSILDFLHPQDFGHVFVVFVEKEEKDDVVGGFQEVEYDDDRDGNLLDKPDRVCRSAPQDFVPENVVLSVAEFRRELGPLMAGGDEIRRDSVVG